MNILVIAHFQNDGSPTAIFIHNQLKAYVSLGHNVNVIVPIAIGKKDYYRKRVGPIVRKEKIDGINHFFLRYFSISKYGEKYFNSKQLVLASKIFLKNKKDFFNSEIIHAHTFGVDSELGFSMKKLLKCPLVVTTHGTDTLALKKRGEDFLLKKRAEKADAVICVSEKIKNALEQIGINTRFFVVYNGYVKRSFSFNNEKGYFFSDTNKLIINQTGSLINQKNTDLTIRAVAKLCQNNMNIRLNIVGEGPQKKQLMELTKLLKIEKRVSFRGQLNNEEAQREMNNADIFVMPSVREGFGIVYLEAMDNACLTIATKGEGIDGFIKNGVNGLLVEPKVENIVNTINWASNNKEKAKEIINNGTKSVNLLSWEGNAAKYIEIFSGLLRI